MSSEKDYIDKLYSEKFEKFEFQSFDDDWSKISPKLSTSNFLKFSFSTFNIYTLVLALPFIGAIVYFGITNIKLSDKVEKLENKIELLQEQKTIDESNFIIIDSTDVVETTSNPEPNNEINLNTSKKKELQAEPEDNELIINSKQTSSSLEKDSAVLRPDSFAIIKPDSTNSTKVKIQRIKKVKKTIYIKRDRVIITDTVKIKKRK